MHQSTESDFDLLFGVKNHRRLPDSPVVLDPWTSCGWIIGFGALPYIGGLKRKPGTTSQTVASSWLMLSTSVNLDRDKVRGRFLRRNTRRQKALMERDARFPLLWQPSALVGHDVQLWLQYTRHEFVKRILVATDSTDAAFWDGLAITIGLVEVIGRKTIQLIGFAGNAVFLAILGVKYHTLKNETGPFFVVFVFLQLFF
ncbi:hypothetical protein A4X09_0g7804, partial [Tilletia walkeri]